MTEFEIYSHKFYENLDKRIEQVEEENKDLPFLPLDEYMKQQTIVENFLRKYNLKIYGGVALDKFMPENDKIYPDKKGKIIDYEIAILQCPENTRLN